ncbi:MAG: biotin transporter BioY [Lachnospiraceae bacterium]|jgi:biotin transport system substrate-specific component|nr:biotin transporter BioY [Lachnospiraceae bacterium]
MRQQELHGLRTIDLAYVAMGAVLMAVCSWISIPTVIPVTLQTFAVFTVLQLLGGKRGTMAIITYILMAAVGIPVLAGFSGGLGAILGMTGGYIVGFVFIGLTYWIGEMLLGDKVWVRITTMILGMAGCYAFGTIWFTVVYSHQTEPIGIATALGWCVIPFIIPDAIKLTMSVVLSARLRKAMKN